MYRLPIGRVLARSFIVWASNVVPFLILAFVITFPYTLYVIARAPGPTGVDDATGVEWRDYVWVFAEGLLSNTLRGVLCAALAFGVFQALRGEKGSVRVSVTRGFACLVRVLGTAVAVSLFVSVFSIAAFLAFCSLIAHQGLLWRVALGDGSALLTYLLVPIVLLLGPILGILIYSRLWLAIPAVVVERTGVFASLSRSWRLTRGIRLAVFSLVLVLMLLLSVAGILLSLALEAVGISGAAIEWLVPHLAWIVAVSLVSVAATVTYHDIRVGREGILPEDMASVFD